VNIVAFVLKILGSLLLAFIGYFIAAAVGWPGGLDAMVLERTAVGGAFGLLGLLCLIATFIPKPRRKASAVAPFLADPEPARPSAAPEPRPLAEHPPAPVVAVAPEAESEPQTEPDITPAAAPEAHPASLSAVRALLDTGDAAFADGRIEEALEPYSEALDMARSLDQAAPSEETRELLACALKAVGDAHDECGRLDPATLAYEEALSIRRAQLEAEPAEPARKRALSLILERLGDVRDARGHTIRAMALYRTSLPIAESLATEDPDNVVYREDLAQTRRRLAELEAQLEAAD
jgi:hypothetical protein